MGQYWQIINLDTMETLGNLGKLGEGLWGEHQNLIQLISAPPCPPKPQAKYGRKGRRSPTPRRSPSSPATFDDLLAAREIITTVFTHLHAFSDVLRFALTSSQVWNCGVRRIEQAYVQYQAPWKGHRLICLGDYALDIPKHLNNATDLCQFGTTLGYSKRDCHVWYNGQNPNGHPKQGGDEADDSSAAESDTSSITDSPEPVNVRFEELITDEAKERWERRLGKLVQGINNYARPAERGVHPDYDLMKDARLVPQAEAWVQRVGIYRGVERLQNNPWSMSTVSDTSREEGSSASEEPETDAKPEPVMLLRNLTKRQYVRSDLFATNGKDSVWGFGKAILSRISWSTDSSVAMSWDGKIHRGRWAGDAFDVVRASEVAKDWHNQLLASGWEDVTSDVREEMRLIWKSEFFEKWWAHSW